MMQRKTCCMERLYLPVILLMSFLVSYLFTFEMMSKSWTDLAIHVNSAEAYLDGVEAHAYPGFYLVYGFLTRVCGMPQAHGASCSMGIFSVLTGLAVYVVSSCVLGWKSPRGTRALIVLFINFFGPLYLGGDSYYLGPGSFNTWHNPTNSGVKFIALLSFFLFTYIYEMQQEEPITIYGKQFRRVHLYMLLVLLTCCSLLFKPSFFQVFAPFLAAVYGLDFLMRKRSFKSCVADALLFLPAVALILYQMFAEIGGGETGGGIFISFARAWSYHTDSVFLSVMANALFPLFVCIFCGNIFSKHRMLYYSMLFYIVGVGEGLFLCESGPRISHGNFLWGNSLGIGIVYVGAVLCFVKYIQNTKENETAKQKVVRYAGNGILAVQFVLGVGYLLRCIICGIEYF